MKPLSPRFAPLLLALFVVCAVPIGYHAVARPVQEDCARPAQFFSARRVGGTRVIEKSRAIEKLESVEGRFLGEKGGLRVARVETPGDFMGSALDLAFEPQLYIGRGELREIPTDDGVIPVRWHESSTPSRVFLEGYSYVQAGRPTSHPLRTSLPLVFDQLLRGTRPLTVVIVGSTGRPEERETLEREMEAVFARTWRQLRAACIDAS